MKWEYIQVVSSLAPPSGSTLIIYSGVGSGSTRNSNDVAFMAKLNELGNQGWELVAVDRHGALCCAYLKRAKGEQDTVQHTEPLHHKYKD